MKKKNVAIAASILGLIIISIVLVFNMNKDTTPPVITVSEDFPTAIEVGLLTEEPDWTQYFTVIDNEDGEITVTDEHLSWLEGNTINLNINGTYTLMLRISDSSGNSSSVQVTIFVKDDATSPVITFTNETDILLEAGSDKPDFNDYFTITDNQDNIEDISIYINAYSLDMYTLGTYNIYISATDTSDNTSTEILTVYVVDTTAPVITLVNDVQTSFEFGEEFPDWSQYYTVYDVITYDQNIVSYVDTSSLSSSEVGEFELVIYATDEEGNQSQLPFTITINDSSAPDLETDDNLPTSFEVGTITEEPDWTKYFISSDDYDGELSITHDDLYWKEGLEIDFNTLGEYTLVATITDSNNNSSTIELVLSVVDTTPPNVNLNPYLLATTFEAGSYISDWSTYYTTSDNYYSGEYITVSVNSSDLIWNRPGEYNVLITATDDSNNTIIEELTITIIDTLAPVISLEQDIQTTFEVSDAQPDWNSYFTVTDNGTATGNINIDIVLTSLEWDVIGSHRLIINATDTTGNSTTEIVNIYIEDNTPPVVEVNPDNLATTFELDSILEVEDWAKYFTVIDNHDSLIFITDSNLSWKDNLEIDTTTSGHYTLLLSVSDSNGNYTSSELLLTVSSDITAPAIDINPGSLSTTFEAGSVISDWSIYYTVSDNQDLSTNISVIIDSSNVLWHTPAEYIIYIYATDLSNNTSVAELIITITDTTAPTITILNDIETEFEVHSYFYDWYSYFTVNDVTMDQMYILLFVDDSSINWNELGDYTVTVGATDIYNNTSTKEITISIVDTTAPVVTNNNLPTTIESSDDLYTSDWTEYFVVTDNYDGIIEITDSNLSWKNGVEIDYNLNGEYVLVLKVQDSSDNSTTYELIFTISSDTIAPVIVVDNDSLPTTIEAGDKIENWTQYYTVSDNIDITDIIDVEVIDADVIWNKVGTYNISIIATDSSNNTSIETIYITIIDTTAPVITISEDITTIFEVNSSQPDWNEYFTVSDNGTDEMYITTIITVTNGVWNFLGEVNVIITAQDESNNTSETSFTVTLVDTTAPVITLNPDSLPTSFEPTFNKPDWYSYFIVADNYELEYNITTYVDTALLYWNTFGTYDLIITALDSSGNYTRATLTIEIADVTAPIIEVNSSLPTSFEASSSYDIDWTAYFSINDNYDGEIEVNESMLDLSSVDLSVGKTFTVIITVTDSYNNISTESIDINVLDSIAPVISFNPNEYDTLFEYSKSAPLVDWTTYFSATDNFDGNYDIKSSMINSSDVDWTKLGNYAVYITVTDGVGNTSTESISISIVDTTAPVITLDSSKSTTIALGSDNDITSLFEYFTVTDIYDGSIPPTTEDISWNGNQIDFNVEGTYTMVLTILDSSNNVAEETITFVIEKDASAPDISINPSSLPTSFEAGPYSIEQRGINWLNYFIIIDDFDGSIAITEEMLDTNSVDFITSGEYQISIAVQDSSGNSAISYLTITITDVILPTYTLINDLEFEAGPYNDVVRGISCYDYISVSDLSGIENYSCTITSFDWTNEGINTDVIEIVITDKVGNTLTDYISISLTAAITPNISQTNNLEFEAGQNDYIDRNIVCLIYFNISDSSGIESVTCTISDFDWTEVGEHKDVIEVSAVDKVGNTITSYYSITILSEESSIISISSTITYEAGPYDHAERDISCTEYISATDISGVMGITCEYNDIDWNTVGTHSDAITVTVEDNAGNKTIQYFSITLIDSDVSVINSTSEFIYEAGPYNSSDRNLTCTNYFSASDYSGVKELICEYNISDWTEAGTHENAVTVIVLDNVGNTTTKYFSVTLTTATDSVVTAKSTFVYEAGPYNDSQRGLVCINNFIISDTSGLEAVYCDYNIDDWSIVGNHQNAIIVTVVDKVGNESYSYFTITLTEVTLPTIVDYVSIFEYTDFTNNSVYEGYARLNTIDNDINSCTYTYQYLTHNCNFPRLFSNVGEYSITMTDFVGNVATYYFMIEEAQYGFTSGQVDGSSYSETQVVTFDDSEYSNCNYWRNDEYIGNCNSGNIGIKHSGTYLFIIVHSQTTEVEQLNFVLDLGNEDYKFNLDDNSNLEVNTVYNEYTLFVDDIGAEPIWNDLINILDNKIVYSISLVNDQIYDGEGRYYIEIHGGKTGIMGYYINVVEV